MKLKLNKNTFLVGALALYLSSAGISYAVFNQISGSANPLQSGLPLGPVDGLDIDPSEPRDQACPLNGAYYTKTEQAIWAARRPLAIMVENSADARPHSGLNRADIIYEAVSEGGVTRFMPIYLCDSARSDVVVAPVRSVRSYFIDWASEFGKTPLFGNVGGANCSGERLPNGNMGPCKSDPRTQAIELLASYGWRHAKGNNLDQFSVGAKAYIRNETRTGQPVATEHSVEGRTEKLYQVALERGWTNLDLQGRDWNQDFRPWKFKDDAAEAARGSITPIAYDFWDGYKQFDARWQYDRATNAYQRFTGGEPHLDLETGKQLTAKSVIVLLTKEIGPVDSLKHMLYQTTGTGKALIFQDGQVIEANWEKKDRTARTIYTDKKGQEVTFTRGRIWISVVDTATKVSHP
jgi:hypothetical protein